MTIRDFFKNYMECRYSATTTNDKEIINIPIDKFGRVYACNQLGFHFEIDAQAALEITDIAPYIRAITKEWDTALFYPRADNFSFYKIVNIPSSKGPERFKAAHELCLRFEKFHRAMAAIPAVMFKKHQ